MDGKDISCKREWKKTPRWQYLYHKKQNFKTYKRISRALHNDKESIEQDDPTIINIYVPNNGAPKYLKHILIPVKEERVIQ